MGFDAPEVRHRDIFVDVKIRAEGEGRLHADVYERCQHESRLRLLAVPGAAVCASTYARLSNAILSDPEPGQTIGRVVAVDLFGRGASEVTKLPAPMRFGDIGLEDFTRALLQFIDGVKGTELAPQVIVAHSMGALLVQAAQELLLQQGSTLSSCGVRGVVLLAPVPNRNCAWTQRPSSALAPYVVTDEALGAYVELSPEYLANNGAWQKPGGALASTAPTAEVIRQAQWLARDPLTMGLELVGLGGRAPRPAVRRGAFSPRHGTNLALISFEHDAVTPMSDHPALYASLTNNEAQLYYPIDTDDAVHCMHITNPAPLLPVLRAAIEAVVA